MKRTLKFATFFLLSCAGCVKERDVRKVVSHPLRLSKSAFQGDFTYLKSVVAVDSPGDKFHWIPQGLYLNEESLVSFEIQETQLLVVNRFPKIQQNRPAKATRTLARFPIRNVDILRKQNSLGEDTHEEEITESRREASQREYLVFEASNPAWDPLDPFAPDTRHLSPAQSIALDANDGSIHFTIERRLDDGTSLSIRYSFARTQNSSYSPKHYSQEIEPLFGFFKTVPDALDDQGNVSVFESKRTQVINRRSTERITDYYFTPDFPQHLKPSVEKAFQDWNQVFQKTIGKTLLRLRENTGQQLGDVRYNLVVYEKAQENVHQVLGYGPSLSHPLSGEILKGDVILYGGTLKRAVFKDSLLRAQIGKHSELSVAPMTLPRDSRTSVTAWLKHQLPSMKFLDQAFPQEKKSSAPFPNFFKDSAPTESSLREFTHRYHPQMAAAQLKEEWLKPFSHHSTRLNDSVTQTLRTLYQSKNDDVSVETKILGSLVLHELGHTLGLRHNFKASADPRGGMQSSVMDYAFLASEEPVAPGTYDEWAITVGYGDGQHDKEAASQKLLYCTDHQIYSSLDPLCAHHDSGKTLTQLVEHYQMSYYSSFAWNNLRLDREHFGKENREQYLARVLTHLLPIRLIHDYADAILRSSEKKDYVGLWKLLRSQIESDKTTASESIVSIKVTDGETIKREKQRLLHGQSSRELLLDQTKIASLVTEANSARLVAFTALVSILFDNRRSDYDVTDEVANELHRIGVLPDKLLVLLLLGVPLPDPITEKVPVSPFSSFQKTASHELFLTLISDILPASGAELISGDLDTQELDFSLRKLAVFLIKTYLGNPNVAPHARELVRLEKITLPVSDEFTRFFENYALWKAHEELSAKLRDWEPHMVSSVTISQWLETLFPTPSLSLVKQFLDPLRSQDEWNRMNLLDYTVRIASDLNANIKAVENKTEGDRARWLYQEKVRLEIRHAYRNYFRVQLQIKGAPMSVDEAKSEVIKKEQLRHSIATSYAGVSENSFLKASQTIFPTSVETATGYLLRDNIGRKEDRWLAVRELAELVKLEMDASKTNTNNDLYERLLVEAAALHDRYLTERAFAESIALEFWEKP